MKLIVTDLETFELKNGYTTTEDEYQLIKPQGKIHHCVGCFGCWVKTPGKCVIHDGYENIGIMMGSCTELILISQCCYGSVSPFVKAVLDRAISYIHPDFVLRKGEMHHKRRYKNVISISAHFYARREESNTNRNESIANCEESNTNRNENIANCKESNLNRKESNANCKESIAYDHPAEISQKMLPSAGRMSRASLLCSTGEGITDMEKETARNILEANADNYDGVVKKICFYKTEKELENIAL